MISEQTKTPAVLKERIYLLDLETPSLNLLQEELRKINIEPRHFSNFAIGIREIRSYPPDLIMIDPHLGENGNLDLIQNLKSLEEVKNIPLVISSCSGEEETLVRSLELGGDDYISKPLNVRETVSKIRSLLRRKKMTSLPREEGKIEIGNLTIKLNDKEVQKNGKSYRLTGTETRILKELISKPGSAVSRTQLIASVWNEDQIVEDQNLDVHISSIRKKIETNPSRPEILATLRGHGYKLNLPRF